MQDIIPADIMLPPARLQALVGQAVRLQMAGGAALDNDPSARVSLYSDWTGSLRTLPVQCAHVLREHRAQVWTAQFSSNGEQVVTGSKDGTVCIWNVRPFALLCQARLCVHKASRAREEGCSNVCEHL